MKSELVFVPESEVARYHLRVVAGCVSQRQVGRARLVRTGRRTWLHHLPQESTIMLSGSSQGESSVLRVRLMVVKKPLRISISISEYALDEWNTDHFFLVCIRNGLVHICNGLVCIVMGFL